MNLYFAGKRKRHNYHHKNRKRSVQYDNIERTLKTIIQISHGQFSTEDNIENFARTVSNSYLAKRRSR